MFESHHLTLKIAESGTGSWPHIGDLTASCTLADLFFAWMTLSIQLVTILCLVASKLSFRQIEFACSADFTKRSGSKSALCDNEKSCWNKWIQWFNSFQKNMDDSISLHIKIHSEFCNFFGGGWCKIKKARTGTMKVPPSPLILHFNTRLRCVFYMKKTMQNKY